MTSDKGETSRLDTEEGWGSTDPTGGWGVDTSVGWGGSGGGGWDSGANEGSASVGEGWGGVASGVASGGGGGKSVDNANTVPSGTDQKGKSKERQREDVEMRDPSPSRTVGSFKSSSHKQESAPPPPARNTPPLSTVAPKPARPVPLPLPSRQKKTQLFEDGNLKKLAVQSLKNKEAGQVQERQNSLSLRGPKGRADLFSQVIK
jgi:hypothetical protein